MTTEGEFAAAQDAAQRKAIRTKKPKSAARKGDETETRAADYLRGLGWTVHQTRRVKFHENDIFGCFDLIATKSHMLRFIQVSTQQIRGEVLREMRRIPVPRGEAQKEYWVWREKESAFRIYDTTPEQIGTAHIEEAKCLS